MGSDTQRGESFAPCCTGDGGFVPAENVVDGRQGSDTEERGDIFCIAVVAFPATATRDGMTGRGDIPFGGRAAEGLLVFSRGEGDGEEVLT